MIEARRDGVKNLTLSYIRANDDQQADLACPGSIRQILRVRWLGLLVMMSASVAHAAPSSNPAFLGIEMQGQGVGCQVREITACSPAKDAGLRFGDVITAMDGAPIFDGMQPP